VKEKELMRPSDMFYSKIIPILKDHGITNITLRKDWPLEVMKRVFKELEAETPRLNFSFLTF
jgi:PI-3-kinase-related kinase SMG-1